MENMEDKVGVTFPDPQADYHGHPAYANIFLWLMVFFGVSLAAGYFVSPNLAVFLILLTAVIKAVLVVRNFMHLKFEPWPVLIVVALVFFVLLALFFGVYPDIPIIERVLAK